MCVCVCSFPPQRHYRIQNKMFIPLLFYCIFGFIYIYKGCNGSQNSQFGSIRHSGVTVRYVFDTGVGVIGYVAMLEIFLF